MFGRRRARHVNHVERAADLSRVRVLRPELWSKSAPEIRSRLEIKAGRSLHIVGPYNSGTNFAVALLARNGISTTDAAPSAIKTLAFKHYPFEVASRAMSLAGETWDGVVVVVMTRHPISWIESLKKSPYELVFPDLISPARIDLSAINHGLSYRDALKPVLSSSELEQAFSFKSAVHYWNSFYNGYAMAHRAGQIEAVFMRYEDLVASTAECTQVLSRIVRVDDLVELTIPMLPSKDHGSPSGYLTARRKLISSPIGELSKVEERQVSSQADRFLAECLGYPLVGRTLLRSPRK